MSKAIYHPEAGRELTFDVIAKNDDGTVNLAYEGEIVVSSCAVTTTPTIGACVMVEDEKATKQKDK